MWGRELINLWGKEVGGQSNIEYPDIIMVKTKEGTLGGEQIILTKLQ